VWQDFAQIEARYGPRAATVVNNHRAKLVCSGIADPATLEQVSRLIGDEERSVETLTVDRAGAASSTSSPSDRRLAPAAWLRRISPGEAVLVYGHLPPVRVTLRPYFAERRWRGQAGSPAPGCGGRRRSHLRRPSWRWRRRIATVRGDGVAEPRRTGQVPVASSAPCGPGAGGEDLSGKPF
jgi:type IV secretory pathway TraG/TraD family ATPase VirD4